MAELFADGRIVDLILVLVAVEAALLVLWRRRTGRGPAAGAVVAMLLPGVLLLVALRLALAGADWRAVAAALAAAGLAHLFDLALRNR